MEQTKTKIEERGGNWYGITLLIPILLLWIVTYVAPLILLVMISFVKLNSVSLEIEAVTIDNYGKFLGDPFYQGVFLQTLNLAFVTTILTLILGLPLAIIFIMARPSIGKLLLILIISPILMSAVVRSYGWIIILGGNGFINSFLRSLGIIDRPIRFLFNFTGVTIGLTQILLPFMVLPIISVLQRGDQNLAEAAANLGATRTQTLMRVTLPLSLPGILAGGTLVFVLAYAHFAVPQLLGGGSFLVNSTLIYQQATAVLDYGGAAALSMILLVSSILIVLISNIAIGRYSSGAQS
jgi:putative spermidine/putrescine transport system permease protein